jgi:hypothetical protein
MPIRRKLREHDLRDLAAVEPYAIFHFLPHGRALSLGQVSNKGKQWSLSLQLALHHERYTLYGTNPLRSLLAARSLPPSINASSRLSGLWRPITERMCAC